MPSHVERIASFEGPNRFLSNFYPLVYPVVDEHRLFYRSVENAYQASKSLYKSDRVEIAAMSAAKAKTAGKKLNLREDWEQIKRAVMLQFLLQKFILNEDLRECLLDTGEAVLIEGNHHGDRWWGTVNGVGENHLGILLMQVRDLLR
jgi:ribA/ribD-fused uncharacterized protein